MCILIYKKKQYKSMMSDGFNSIFYVHPLDIFISWAQVSNPKKTHATQKMFEYELDNNGLKLV